MCVCGKGESDRIGSLRVYWGAWPVFMHAKQKKLLCEEIMRVLFPCGDISFSVMEPIEVLVGSGLEHCDWVSHTLSF